jgi:Plant transposon protein
MRIPTAAVLGAMVVALNKRVHGVDGMLGSLLDCMHTYYWKNCPVAWQQSFKGNKVDQPLFWKLSPTIVFGFGIPLTGTQVQAMNVFF